MPGAPFVRRNLRKGGDSGWLTSSSYQFRAKSSLLSQNYLGRKTHLAISFRLRHLNRGGNPYIRRFAAIGEFPLPARS
jgi:hypothetical protein